MRGETDRKLPKTFALLKTALELIDQAALNVVRTQRIVIPSISRLLSEWTTMIASIAAVATTAMPIMIAIFIPCDRPGFLISSTSEYAMVFDWPVFLSVIVKSFSPALLM